MPAAPLPQASHNAMQHIFLTPLRRLIPPCVLLLRISANMSLNSVFICRRGGHIEGDVDVFTLASAGLCDEKWKNLQRRHNASLLLKKKPSWIDCVGTRKKVNLAVFAIRNELQVVAVANQVLVLIFCAEFPISKEETLRARNQETTKLLYMRSGTFHPLTTDQSSNPYRHNLELCTYRLPI
ncbi:hypothetical protein PTI98_010504 [Pleurotus ostreatus]|nr:hypothetical protein PTI98_010504 [Pleurotus ostreatus]